MADFLIRGDISKDDIFFAVNPLDGGVRLLELRKGHGRLIDANRIEYEVCESNMPKRYCDFVRRVLHSENLTPTIIPAETEETDG